MPTRRQQRINELLLQELSLLIPDRLDDPRITTVTVTRVESTQDMAHAKVYVTVGSAEDPDASLAALDQARGVISAELGTLGLRRIPQLVFARDKQFESGERVLGILSHLSTHDRTDDAAADAGETEPAADNIANETGRESDTDDIRAAPRGGTEGEAPAAE